MTAAGRPRVYEDRDRGVFYARREQLDSLEARARKEGLSVSEFVVAVLVGAGVMEP